MSYNQQGVAMSNHSQGHVKIHDQQTHMPLTKQT